MKSEAALALVLNFFQSQELKTAQECQRPVQFEVHFNRHTHWRYVKPISEGYLYGIAMSYAKNYCALKENSPTRSEAEKTFLKMINAKPNGSIQPDDSLIHVSQNKFKHTPLEETYALLYSLGPIESDGRYNEGRDQSAFNVEPQTAEAGLFQVSLDSHSVNNYVSKEVLDFLMATYQNGQSPQCWNSLFQINQELSENTESWGWGEGLQFQNAMKACPSLAVDYMAYLLRVTHKHNGPLKRKDAQAKPGCRKLLKKWTHFLNKQKLCGSIVEVAEKLSSHLQATKKLGGDKLSNYKLPKGSYIPLDLTGRPEYRRIAWIKAHIKYLEKNQVKNKKQIEKLQSEIQSIENSPQNIKDMMNYYESQQIGFTKKLEALNNQPKSAELDSSKAQLQRARDQAKSEFEKLQVKLKNLGV